MGKFTFFYNVHGFYFKGRCFFFLLKTFFFLYPERHSGGEKEPHVAKPQVGDP